MSNSGSVPEVGVLPRRKHHRAKYRDLVLFAVHCLDYNATISGLFKRCYLRMEGGASGNATSFDIENTHI